MSIQIFLKLGIALLLLTGTIRLVWAILKKSMQEDIVAWLAPVGLAVLAAVVFMPYTSPDEQLATTITGLLAIGILMLGLWNWAPTVWASSDTKIPLIDRNVFKQLRHVLDATTTATIVTDDTGRILIFSPAAEKLFGYLTHEIKGYFFTAVLAARQPVKHVWPEVIDPRKRVEGSWLRLRGKNKVGHEFPIETHSLPYEEGKFVILIHNVTEVYILKGRLKLIQKGIDLLEEEVKVLRAALAATGQTAVEVKAPAAGIQSTPAEQPPPLNVLRDAKPWEKIPTDLQKQLIGLAKELLPNDPDHTNETQKFIQITTAHASKLIHLSLLGKKMALHKEGGTSIMMLESNGNIAVTIQQGLPGQLPPRIKLPLSTLSTDAGQAPKNQEGQEQPSAP